MEKKIKKKKQKISNEGNQTEQKTKQQYAKMETTNEENSKNKYSR